MPSPRFAYPPMDAILGVDFILRNYINKDKTKNILNTPEYRLMVTKSQERLWKPYFISISSKWITDKLNINDNFNYDKLVPFFCTN